MVVLPLLWSPSAPKGTAPRRSEAAWPMVLTQNRLPKAQSVPRVRCKYLDGGSDFASVRVVGPCRSSRSPSHDAGPGRSAGSSVAPAESEGDNVDPLLSSSRQRTHGRREFMIDDSAKPPVLGQGSIALASLSSRHASDAACCHERQHPPHHRQICEHAKRDDELRSSTASAPLRGDPGSEK
jgi:hypothetical protein